MATIVTRAGKGSALTHNEADANFTNLNTALTPTVVQSSASAITIVRATHIAANGGTIGHLEATNNAAVVTLEDFQAGDRLVVRFTGATMSGAGFALGAGWSCNPTPPTGLTAQYDEYTFTCTAANTLEMAPGVTEDIPLTDLEDINATRLLGRKTASGSGPPEELTASEGRSLLQITDNAFQTVDLTSAAHSAAWGTKLLLTAGANDVNLPAAANNGEWLEIINRTGNSITVNRNGTDTIDGATTYALADNKSVSFVDLSDGTNDIIATPAA